MRDNPFKIHEGAIRDRSIAGYNTQRVSGDNLLFLPLFSGWLGKALAGKQLMSFLGLVVLVFLVLIGRITFLQVVKGSEYAAYAEGNRIKTITLKAPRGILYDRYKRALVTNVPQFAVYVDPQLIASKEQASDIRALLTQKFPESSVNVDALLADYRRSPEQVVVDAITYEQALQLMIDAKDIASVKVIHEPNRRYIEDAGLGHSIGYTGRITESEYEELDGYSLTDVIGKEGIEIQYESILRGTDGSISLEVDALGREKKELSRAEPIRGTDMSLSIDLDAQKKLYEILSSIVDTHDKPGAAAVVMDPDTGDILAMASVPSFDQNIFTERRSEVSALLVDERKPLFNRTVNGEYPAGSVFKLIMSAAALEEKLINTNFTVMSTGGLFLGDRFFPDWRAGGHGRTNIYSAIANSVNTFFYIIGGGYDNVPGLGIDTIGRYSSLFGLGQPTGLDLPTEASGFIPSRAERESHGEQWYQGDTYNVSIGQGSLLVTPLQVARYTSFFANGGRLISPRLVTAIAENPIAPAIDTSSPISQETIEIIQTGMRRTVTDGTATSMQSVPVPVAGKTGTAQFNRNRDPHSWFTGYAPFDNPDIVITVLVEEGGDVGYAVTAARQFMEWYFSEARST